MNEFKLSIIIPVYNAANTLNVCILSLKKQNYANIEYIFVNDCSTDNSLDIINKFAFEMEAKGVEVKVISHSVNGGVAKARNTGLDNATGDYIYYIDADDFIDEGALENMVEVIGKKNLDILGIEWNLCFSRNERYMKQQFFDTPNGAIENLMYGVMRWNLWLFVVRRDLYEKNNIRFIPGENMGEDMQVMIKLFMNSKNVMLLERPYYHYRQVNPNAVSNGMSEKNIKQVSANVCELENYAKSVGNDEVLKLMPFLKLNIKLPLLMSPNIGDYKKWDEWYNDSNSFIMDNKFLPFRTKILQLCAAKKLYFWLNYTIFLCRKLYME
jgi:Glycosyltransferases involved in cell wall biogenesis